MLNFDKKSALDRLFLKKEPSCTRNYLKPSEPTNHKLPSTKRRIETELNLIKLHRILRSGSTNLGIGFKSDYKTLVFQRLLTVSVILKSAKFLRTAVLNENTKLVRKLCLFMKNNSVSLNKTNDLKQTSLHLAVILGNAAIVKLLLDFGASTLLCDQNGSSVLHLAIKHNCPSVLKILLSHEQSKNILDLLDHEGYSALHYAVTKSNEEAIQMMHSSGADMNKKDGKSGRTPLIYAVLNKNLSVITLLLQYGSCPKIADYSGRSALDLALRGRSECVVKLLQHSG